ncbi:hypothetical protein CVS47_02684 [Microbacterium lemovicicum]|uniref:DUF2207 domain-containing protein n=1 Tax=Microbacterium lemovicicum TaxID=1072463 RepID=A0A3S9WDA7_9MICO|nr:DUF2207 domain-containing protein [Microbacterium lemovicicum]AZS38034.1 hypothetical protein CVS47_02684 [Microbacterium lemovicicum]
MSRTRRPARLILSLLAVILPLLLAAPATAVAAVETGDDRTAEAAASVPGIVTAGVDDFSFESMDADYTIGRADDGTSTLRVVETFVALFPDIDQNRGMRRIIPDSYQGQPLFPKLISITDGDGQPRASETDSEDGSYSMTSRADDFVRGSQTYVFTYELRNVTGTFADTDATEFYWDVNGVQWAQPFGAVSARLHVPAALAGSLTGAASCYVGAQGATATCPIDQAPDGDGVVFDAFSQDVAPYQTVTIAVAFTTGTFAQFDSSYLASPWGWAQGVAGLGVLAAVVGAFVVAGRRLRDDPGRPVVIAEYTPPPGIDALESAVLLGKQAKAIPAEVLEQAVVGSIRIIEGRKRFFGGQRLIAELVDPSRADRDGRMLLDGLFRDLTPGAQFEFGSTDTRFSTAAQKILKAADSELTIRGLRKKVPARLRAWPILLCIGAGIGVFLLGFAAITAGVFALVPVLLMVATFVAFFLVGGVLARKPLTAAGAEVRDHLAGLKVFIEWAEADRIRMLQSPTGAERVRIDPGDPREMLRLYETLLPYAVVFGQEKEWAERLIVLYGDHTPTWYYGSGTFNAAAFSSGITSLSSVASSSSSSGGSSGGGSAGGGGGGGGGGGV